jgi:hypothetical protein
MGDVRILVRKTCPCGWKPPVKLHFVLEGIGEVKTVEFSCPECKRELTMHCSGQNPEIPKCGSRHNLNPPHGAVVACVLPSKHEGQCCNLDDAYERGAFSWWRKGKAPL